MKKVLEQINKSATKFLVPLSTEETFKIIVGEAKKIIGGDYGIISVNDKGELKPVYADAEFLMKLKHRKFGNTYNTFATLAPRVVDVDKNKNFHPELKAKGIKSIVHIPLAYKDKSVGVLSIHSLTHKTLTKHDLHIFNLYGSLASMAIRKTQLYDETKNALQTRDFFISLASHELRTPLTSINGYIQLLHSKMKEKDTVESKWVNELYSESKRLTNLVSELLEINRIKQGQLQFNLQENFVNDFFDHVTKQFQSFSDREILIDKGDNLSDQKFIGDITKLSRVFLGLLTNAEKFSIGSTPITFSVRVKASSFTMMVSDRGSGIAREDLFKIFNGFNKFSNNEEQGLGVGLLLAKHIVQFHHGKIVIKSRVKKGTTVLVTLPLVK